MGKYRNNRELHEAIADEVRGKTGSGEGIKVEDLPEAVGAIESMPTKYTANVTCLNNTQAVDMIRNSWHIQGRVKIILADDIKPDSYECLLMWIDEDDAGVCQGYNRSNELFAPGLAKQTRFLKGHHYWVMPCDTVPSKPTA